MINGYNNRGVDVNLSTGKINYFNINEDILIKTLGGRGLGVYYFSKHVSPRIDALSEENALVISSGGLGGSLAPTGGRFSVTFKSPLTGTICSSNSGGFWGSIFKRTGYDVLIIKGKASVPVCLYISEGRVDIIECPELWGKTIPVLTDKLREKYTKKARVLGIGPAGENRVKYASMVNDYHRTNARGGGGAVMGSKNLKAIVVEGKKKFIPSNRELYQAGIYQADKLIRSMPVTSMAFPELGTDGLLKMVYEHDMLPHRNFQDVYHAAEDVAKISGECLRKEIFLSKKGCFNCRIQCGRSTQVGKKKGEGPEFETVALMGANLCIYDIKEIALANYLCNELGIDTISFGNTIGLAMELYEKNIIDKKNTGGFILRFGERGILEHLVHKTAYREDFGNEIAEGALRLARRHGAEELAAVVKGLELPGYDPRASLLQALGYATSPRGGCHLKGGYAITLGFFGGSREVDRFLVDTTAEHIVTEQDSGCIADSLGVCRFSYFSIGENELSRIYSGFTGVDLSPNDLRNRAKGTINMERMFNTNAGFYRKDDTLPLRFFNEKILISGKMRAIDRETQFLPMLRKYFEVRKWNEDGIPSLYED